MGRGRQKFGKKREIMWYEQAGLCYFCGLPMVWRDYGTYDNPGPMDATIDHLDELGHINRGKGVSFYRIVLSCSRCNRKRGLDYGANKALYSRLSFFEEFRPAHVPILMEPIE